MNRTEHQSLELRVIGGLHAGAALVLLEDQIILGSADDCDVILLDDGVLEHHLTLSRDDQGNWMRMPEMTLLQPDTPIQIGQAVIMLCLSDAPWSTLQAPSQIQTVEPKPVEPADAIKAAQLRKAKRILVGMAVLLLVLTGLSFVEPRSLAQSVDSPDMQPKSRSLAAAVDADTIQQNALRLLKEQGLQDLVSLRQTTDQLHFEGQLSEQEHQRFQKVLEELRHFYGDQYQLDAEIQPLKQSLPFEIREVLYGAVSNITLATGERLMVGDSHSGLRLVEIRPGVLVFTGKRTIEVSW